MRWASIHILAFVTLVGFSMPTGAAETTLLPPQSDPFWNAVGRITFGPPEDTGGCTGTLVGVDLVLTAGHCVPSAQESNPRTVSSITFAAGWGDGRAVETRQAILVHRHPDYRHGQNSLPNISSDLALIRLARPIQNVPPMPLGPKPRALDDLTLAGYVSALPQALSITAPCGHLSPQPNLMFLTCPVVGGNSGGPVISGTGEDRRLVAVISSRGRGGAYAAQLDDWLSGFLVLPPQ